MTQAFAATAAKTAYVDFPQAGTTVTQRLEPGAYTQFGFTLNQIENLSVRPDGALEIKLTNKAGTLVIENFRELADSAESCGRDTIFQLLDQQANSGPKVVNFTPDALLKALDPALANDKTIALNTPMPHQTREVVMEPGQTYKINFDWDQAGKTVDGTNLMVSFKNGGILILRDFVPVTQGNLPPALTLADGTTVDPSTLITAACVPVAGGLPHAPNIEPAAGDAGHHHAPAKHAKGPVVAPATVIAAIEPAAGGDSAPSGGRGGAGFSSGIDPADLSGLNPLGPIGPTALAYDIPRVQDTPVNGAPTAAAAVPPPEVPENPAPLPTLETHNAQVYEDGRVTLNLSASASDDAATTVVIAGLPADWGVEANGGAYDPSAGTVTYVVPAGETFSGGPTLIPPHNSDADIPQLNVTATATDPEGQTTTLNGTIAVITDAVADEPTLSVTTTPVGEGESAPLLINTAPTDTDGSEEITAIYVSGLPEGFTLNHGTVLSDGRVLLTPAELTGLTVTPPVTYGGYYSQGYSGTVDLTIQTVVEETHLSGTEFDLTNNTATKSVDVTLTFGANASTPHLTVSNCQVYEDGAIQVPVTATLGDTDGSEFLTITMTGIPNTWGVNANGGTYDPATGTITYVMPAGQNFSGGPTLSPPANSDEDLPDIQVTATATETATGATATIQGVASVTTDAVADTPNLTATAQAAGEGQSANLTIATAPTDTDGSEVITAIYVSGLPAGFTLNHGVVQSDGRVLLTPAQLDGLRLNPPAGYAGAVDLTVTSVVTETNLSGDEFDLTNNTAERTVSLSVNFGADVSTPDLTVYNCQVYEDGSIQMPVIATLGDTDGSEFLTVTITGIPNTWGVNANGGAYDATTGTITYVLPAGQNFSGGPTLSPPANSDEDLPAIQVTATATETATGATASVHGVASITTDAVADMPEVIAAPAQGTEDHSVPLSISVTPTDKDGSETITAVYVAGLPEGFTLNKGVAQTDGRILLTPAELAGLNITPPANYAGTIHLTVTGVSTETNLSGNEFDLTNNTASRSVPLNITFGPVADVPGLVVHDQQVYEDGSIYTPVTATLGDADGSEFLTVTITGIPNTWGVDANGGTYNATTGTVTYTVPAGEDFTGGPILTPPGNSDADLPDLTVQAVATESATGATAQIDRPMAVITDAVADVPNLSAAAQASGVEGAPIDLSIDARLNDTDGSEILSLRISGLPAGATLNHGTRQSDGSYVLTPGDTDGLKLTPPAGYADTFTLTVTATATETNFSGDEFDLTNNTASRSVPITINVIADGKPEIGDAAGAVDETALGPVTIDGALSFNYGADGKGTTGTITPTGVASFVAGGSLMNGALTHNGDPVTVTLNGNTYLGQTASANIFTLTVNADGTYNFNLLSALDHANTQDPNDTITLDFGVTIRDADGDADTGTITITVRDDAPVAVADQATVTSGTATGNVLNNDTLSHDAPTRLALVTLNNHSVEVPSTGTISVTGQYGTLVIGADGSYTYTANNGANGTDNITYTLRDMDGDTSQGTLNITTADGTPHVADNATGVVDETNLGNAIINGTLTFDYGADGKGATGGIAPTGVGSFTAGGSMLNGALTHNGVPVTVTLDGHTYTGHAGATNVFTLTVNPDGTYNFTQLATLDHANASDPNDAITLGFGVTIRDADGDAGTGTITVTVRDDAPVAVDDECITRIGYYTFGDVSENDTASHDGVTKVTAITHDGVTYNIAPGSGTVIHGTYGDLTMTQTGEYMYNPYDHEVIVSSARLDPVAGDVSATAQAILAKNGFTVQAIDPTSGAALTDLTWVDGQGIGSQGQNSDYVNGTREALRIDIATPADIVKLTLGNLTAAEISDGIRVDVYGQGSNTPTTLTLGGGVSLGGGVYQFTMEANDYGMTAIRQLVVSAHEYSGYYSGYYSDTGTTWSLVNVETQMVDISHGDESFGYTIADGDGDMASALLNIRSVDTPPGSVIIPVMAHAASVVEVSDPVTDAITNFVVATSTPSAISSAEPMTSTTAFVQAAALAPLIDEHRANTTV